MSLEWSVAGLLLAAALWPLVRKTRSWGARVGTISLLIAVVLGGLVWKSRAHNRMTARNQLLQKLPAENRPGGFVRSETCRSCHPDQHQSWHRTFHRTMTQQATPEAVRGNFTNVTLTLENEVYQLTRRGDEFRVEMTDPDWKYVRLLQDDSFRPGQGPEPHPPRVEKRITMTTGSHHMQAYWVAGDFGNQQFSFPFTYLFEEARWVPRNDVFMLPPEAPSLQQVWNSDCLGCHATAGQPQQDPRTYVMNTRVAEYGIGCEACHGPGQEHVRANSAPLRRYARHRQHNGDSTIVNPARLSSQKSSEVCGQCHAARYSRDHGKWLVEGTEYWPRKEIDAHRPLLRGRDWEQVDPAADEMPAAHFSSLTGYFWRDGMVRVSGREYNGLVETPCFQRGAMSCLSCHSMHKMTDPDDQLARGMESDQACYQCHREFPGGLAQHTHHAANSSGSLCYNCHMPHTTYGLLKAIRSHQLTSPSVKTSLDTGRPIACNLCHLDQTMAWTAKALHQWYRQPVPAIESDFAKLPASAVWLLRGDAGQRALIAWHMGWAPAKQASGTNWLVPYLAETLDDPYAVVRYVGQRSLKHLPGYEHLAYDYIAPVAQSVHAKSEILQRWNPGALPARENAKILLPRQMSQLLQRRDHRRIELLE
jgi:predicted CXXCH cytochrome family protein